MCEVMGVTEDFSAFLNQLRLRWGWWILQYSVRSVSRDQIKSSGIDDESRRIIKEYNRLAIGLYGFALCLVERLRKESDAGEGLAQ